MLKKVCSLLLPPACRPDHNREREGVGKKRKVHFLHKYFLQNYSHSFPILSTNIHHKLCLLFSNIHGAVHIFEIIVILIETNVLYIFNILYNVHLMPFSWQCDILKYCVACRIGFPSNSC